MDPWERSFEERLKDARENKVKGTEKFKQGNYKGAGQSYINALRGIIPIVHFTSEEDEKEINALKENCYSNLAACQLKLEQYNRVIVNCTKSLELNSENVKCFYRRAQAHLECQNVNSAKEDIDRVLTLEPGNSAVKELERKMATLNKKSDEHHAKMMKSFLASCDQ